jgi:hypothetical protein
MVEKWEDISNNLNLNLSKNDIYYYIKVYQIKEITKQEP